MLCGMDFDRELFGLSDPRIHHNFFFVQTLNFIASRHVTFATLSKIVPQASPTQGGWPL